MKYVERAAKEMAMYLEELQCSNGLFYHAPDVPYLGGRGNGWMAAGMTEVLRFYRNQVRIIRVLYKVFRL